jgi:hypothetical protein
MDGHHKMKMKMSGEFTTFAGVVAGAGAALAIQLYVRIKCMC